MIEQRDKMIILKKIINWIYKGNIFGVFLKFGIIIGILFGTLYYLFRPHGVLDCLDFSYVFRLTPICKPISHASYIRILLYCIELGLMAGIIGYFFFIIKEKIKNTLIKNKEEKMNTASFKNNKIEILLFYIVSAVIVGFAMNYLLSVLWYKI